MEKKPIQLDRQANRDCRSSMPSNDMRLANDRFGSEAEIIAKIV
jgi:hypothetical protein